MLQSFVAHDTGTKIAPRRVEPGVALLDMGLQPATPAENVQRRFVSKDEPLQLETNNRARDWAGCRKVGRKLNTKPKKHTPKQKQKEKSEAQAPSP